MKLLTLFFSLAAALPHMAGAAGPAPEVKLSKSFAEPVDGNTRLLMMKNGNTLLFHFKPREGIRISVYDSTGKQKKNRLVTGKEWEAEHLNRAELAGLYEINGDAVIFLAQMVRKTPSLFRIVLDAQTAAVKREDKLAETPKYNILKGYAMYFGGVSTPELRVEKDPESGYYAISVLNGFASDRNERLEIVHYDSTHREINRAFYLTITSLENMKGFKARDRHSRATMLHFIDPEQLVTRHRHFLENSYASTYAREHLGYKDAYTGIPQHFMINPDHTITVMSEELLVSVYNSGSSSNTVTDLGDIGISRYNRLGQEVGGFAIAKRQQLNGGLAPLYLYKKQHGAWSFRTGSVFFSTSFSNPSFFSYDYVNSGDAEYVLFNDYAKNIDGKDTPGSKKRMRFVSDANTVCYRHQNNQLEKFYLFGDPGDRDLARFMIVEGSTRSPDGKTFATVMLERAGSVKRAYIAWIKF